MQISTTRTPPRLERTRVKGAIAELGTLPQICPEGVGTELSSQFGVMSLPVPMLIRTPLDDSDELRIGPAQRTFLFP